MLKKSLLIRVYAREGNVIVLFFFTEQLISVIIDNYDKCRENIGFTHRIGQSRQKGDYYVILGQSRNKK